MKRSIRWQVSLFFIFLPVFLWPATSHRLYSLEDFNVDFDEESKSIEITSHLMPGAVVRIDEDYRLFINHTEVTLSEADQRLLAQYYEQCLSLKRDAKKIGLQAGKLTIKTIVGLGAEGLYALFSSLVGAEDGEKHIKKTEQEIEEEAERLKKLSQALKKKVKRLEQLHCRIFEEIDVLHQLVEER